VTKAFDEIGRIESLFTAHEEGSPVWTINHSPASTIEVEPEIYRMIVTSESLWKLTGGSFDAGLEKLIHAWGFDGEEPHLPSDVEIREALENSGFDKLQLLDGLKIHREADVGFDFGAVAKGYAVDRAVDVLRKAGVREALVNAGGEVKGIGNGWVIGIQHPRNPGELVGRMKLNGLSVATSGDYQKYFESNGIRYHSIMNPFNGYPARGIRSVTVIHPECATADGIATAVFVMGKDKGMKLVEELEPAEAMIIDDSGGVTLSSGFRKFLLK
jgi:thiamine biosynthesis lipoprotein